MGRRSSGSRSRTSSAFGRSSKPSSSSYKPTTTTPPKSGSSTSSSTSSNTKPNQQTTTAPTTGGGSGIFGSFMGSAMGSMAGMYVANKLFSSSESPETMAAIDKEMGVCSQPFKSFLQCLESNPDNIGSCQWSYSLFNDCQSEKH